MFHKLSLTSLIDSLFDWLNFVAGSNEIIP